MQRRSKIERRRRRRRRRTKEEGVTEEKEEKERGEKEEIKGTRDYMLKKEIKGQELKNPNLLMSLLFHPFSR